MEFGLLALPASPQGFWVRWTIVVVVAIVICSVMRSPIVICTALGVCLAGLIAGFCDNEQLGMFVIVVGLSTGPLIGIAVDTWMTRERRTLSAIGRRYARSYVCPDCGHKFASIQSVGQCPSCERQFTVAK